MPQSLTKIYIHLVFGTKRRAPYIDSAIEKQLHDYLYVAMRNMGCKPIAINGIENHVHCLFSSNKNLSLVDAVQELKSSSSKWIKTKGLKYSPFYWQNGYGAFSVSETHVKKVIRYIEIQKIHHKDNTFEEEYIELLNENSVEYDERYFLD